MKKTIEIIVGTILEELVCLSFKFEMELTPETEISCFIYQEGFF